jgi:hypothetical protein
MKRIRLAAAAALCLAVACTALALAATTTSKYASGPIELGSSGNPVAPSCPPVATCRLMTRTTGLEVLTDSKKYPTTAPAAGRIVAFTVRLGTLSSSLIHASNVKYGGTPQVILSVLHPGAQRKFTLKAQTPSFHITPWLGQTVEFPLTTSLPIAKGDVVALTVPTWAPVLAVNLSKQNAWRASRASHCTDFETQTAQQVNGNVSQYRCLYNTARITYTATFIGTPPTPPKKKK